MLAKEMQNSVEDESVITTSCNIQKFLNYCSFFIIYIELIFKLIAYFSTKTRTHTREELVNKLNEVAKNDPNASGLVKFLAYVLPWSGAISQHLKPVMLADISKREEIVLAILLVYYTTLGLSWGLVKLSKFKIVREAILSGMQAYESIKEEMEREQNRLNQKSNIFKDIDNQNHSNEKKKMNSEVTPSKKPSALTIKEKKCWLCGATSTLLKCSGCRKARYCGKACQEKDWWRHGDWCNRKKEKREKRKSKVIAIGSEVD